MFPRPPKTSAPETAAAGEPAPTGAPPAGSAAAPSSPVPMQIAPPSTPAPSTAPSFAWMAPSFAASPRLPPAHPPPSHPPVSPSRGGDHPRSSIHRHRRLTVGELAREKSKNKQRRQALAIRELRRERRSLKSEIEPPSGFSPPVHVDGDAPVELSPAAAAVHRADVMAPTPAAALLGIAMARRNMVPLAAEEAVAMVYELCERALPEDMPHEERQKALAKCFQGLRRSHQRWAKAEISGVTPVVPPLKLVRGGRSRELNS